jgi:hypothetical protein
MREVRVNISDAPDLIRKKQIERDVFLLESAIKKAPLGDPNDEEMANIYGVIRKHRNKQRR